MRAIKGEDIITTLLNTSPDKIERCGTEAYLFYFASGKDIKTLPIGAKYTVVYSPTSYIGKWHVRSFRVVRHLSKAKIVAQTLDTRLLEPNEITYFERLRQQVLERKAELAREKRQSRETGNSASQG